MGRTLIQLPELLIRRLEVFLEAKRTHARGGGIGIVETEDDTDRTTDYCLRRTSQKHY